jgi:nitroreductase
MTFGAIGMHVLKALEARRSIRHFDPLARMPQEDFDTIISAALLSPSSFNIQHWRIVRVVDAKLREKVRACSFDQEQVTHASEVLLLCADVSAWEKNPGRYWKDAPQVVQDTLIPQIAMFYDNNPVAARDEALRSVGILAQSLMLAATSLGYGSCPMVGFVHDQLAELIKLPEDHIIGLMLAIGKQAEEPGVRGGLLGLDEVLLENGF